MFQTKSGQRLGEPVLLARFDGQAPRNGDGLDRISLSATSSASFAGLALVGLLLLALTQLRAASKA
jgi:hypothetical protein